MEELRKTIEELGKTVHALHEKDQEAIKAITEKGYAPAEVVAQVEKINKDITDLSAMKRQLEDLETKVARSEFQGGGKSEIDKVKDEHKAAFEKWFRKGGDNELQAVKELQVKAGLSTLSDPDGGYIITPPEFDRTIDRVAGTISVMRRLATVRTIGTSEYKKIINAGGTSSGWVAEKESRNETNTPVLKQIAINTKEIYAEPGCTQIELDDSYLDIGQWLADEVSIEFNEEEGASFITGDGVAKPHGIAGYPFIANASYEFGKVGYIAGGHASLLNNADKLVSLVHSLKPVYRNGASFLMNDTTCETIRTLKNGNGDYIWRAGLEQGKPDSLLGKPCEYDDNVASIGAGTYPLFFGNFKRAYLIVDRAGVRILRDPFTSKGNVLFYCTKRVGGGIVMFEAIKALKIAAS